MTVSIRGRYEAFVGWVDAAPRRAAVALTLALCVPLVLCVQYFTDVRAGVQDLLPDDDPAVRAIDALRRRFGGGAAGLIVLVRSPSPSENRRFVRDLGEALRARRMTLVRAVLYDVSAERDWIRARAPLLVPRETFDRVIGEARVAIDQAEREANPLFVPLDEETGKARLRRLRDETDREAARADRFPDGYLASRDGRTVLLRVTLAASDTDVGPARKLFESVRGEVDHLRPGFGRDLSVHYNGEVANLLEEHAAILSDVGLSSVLVTLLVGLLITGYYRSTRALVAVLLSLGPGVIVTFAVARLLGSSLNSNSAFLGSIVVGNGINYPLLLMAYYRAQPLGAPRSEAIARAARQSVAGVAAASTTASAAYFGLTFTSFRGFSQFGSTGGVGMITVALLTFVTAPVAIALLDPPRQAVESTRAQDAVRRWYARPSRSRWMAAAVLVAIVTLSGVGLHRALHEGYWDSDLRDLRNTESVRAGAASWDRTVSAIFGTWLTPVVALAPTPAARDHAANALRAALTVGPRPLAERVETFDRYAPPMDDQRSRVEALAALRRRVDALPRERVPDDARAFLDRWIPSGGVRTIAPGDVPEALREPFTERDGHADRVALVFPSLAVDYDDARNVARFSDRVASARVPEGTVVGGAFLIMAEILRVLRRDALRVIAMVCVLVALALVPIFRKKPLRIPLTVALVTAVALGSQLVMLALGVRLNMLNFAALPITVGVGADYLVNLLSATDALEVDAREATARMGSAIVLCSMTTIVGYVTLLLASSGALRSFGQAAVLGEVVAVLIVLGVYPAFAVKRSR